MRDKFYIQMFGEFHVKCHDFDISDSDNHSHKIWCFLAYLLLSRGGKASQKELVNTLWGSENYPADPTNSMKALLFRTRNLLKELDPVLGPKFIQCKNEEFFINPDIPYETDIQTFEQLVEQADSCTDTDQRLNLSLKALQIYKGNLLPRYANETWVISGNTYYQSLFLNLNYDIIEIYQQLEHYDRIIELCKKICAIEKYEEGLFAFYLDALLHTEQYTEAITVFEAYRKRMYDDLGVRPSSKVTNLYHKAKQGLHTNLMDFSDFKEYMKEDTSDCAIYCELDIFKRIYAVSERSIKRSSNIFHLAMISITDIQGESLSKRSLNIATGHLKDLLCTMLRCGDTITMCSPSQFVVLLPNCNFEDANTVMERVRSQFFRLYPHSPAKLTYEVQPITANMTE